MVSKIAELKKKKKSTFFPKDKSLYFRLLFYFLLLLIPIVIIGLVTYVNSAKMIKNDFQEKISFNMEAASDTIDLYIRSAQETGVGFFNDESIQMYLVPRDMQTPLIRAGLWRIPRIIQRNENIVGGFADSIFVYVDNDVVYVRDGLNEFDTFFNQIHSYEDYNVGFWEKTSESKQYIQLLPKTIVKEKSLGVQKAVVPLVLRSQVLKHNITIVIDIDVNSIEETLRGNSVFNSTAFIVVDDNNQLIYDSHGFFEQLRSRFEDDVNRDKEANHDILKLDGTDYILSSIKSDLYGWRYYAITPYSELSNLTIGILQMTVALSIFFIILGVILSFIFSYNIYDPIKKIKDTIYQKNELLEMSGNENIQMDELDMIGLFIRSLADNNLQYKEKFDLYTNEYVEYSLFSLLKGHKLSDKTTLEETLVDEFNFVNEQYICCSIFFDFKKYFYEDIHEAERLYVLNEIKKVLQGVLSDFLPVYVVNYRQNIYVCIFSIENNEYNEALTEGLKHILSLFRNDEQYFTITMGISRSFNDINDLRTSFNEAMTAISKRSKDESFQIISADNISMSDKFIYTFFDEQKLLNCLKSGDPCNVDGLIDEIFEKNIQSEASYAHIVQLAKELQNLGVRFLAERGQDIEAIESAFLDPDADAKEELNFSVDVYDIKQKIKEFFHHIIDLSGIQFNSRQGNLVSMIMQYIDENYMKDLSLELIADEMGVTAKYVSRVFKENAGMLLTDYINEIRINKAKELLRDTVMKVQDIGQQVGIDNRTTFLRVFKKVEGVSPTEYRAIFKNNGE